MQGGTVLKSYSRGVLLFVETMLMLRKLAAGSEVRGDADRRTGVYTPIHEDSITAATKQFASTVEFGKRSIVNLT